MQCFPYIINGSMKKVVHAACPHDCPDACGVLITIDDGRAVKIQGDPAHPVTRGFLCAKVAKYLDRVYSPDRVLYPMRRVAPKGPPRSFAPPGKDPARRQSPTLASRSSSALPGTRLSTKSSRESAAPPPTSVAKPSFRTLTAGHWASSTLARWTGGFSIAWARRNWRATSVRRPAAPASGRFRRQHGDGAGAVPAGQIHHCVGREYSREQRAPVAVHRGSRRNGAKLVVIDPYRTRTAACADWHLPINPGTDVALALGMMHVIIRNLHDADYVRSTRWDSTQLRAKVTGISAGESREVDGDVGGRHREACARVCDCGRR